MVATLRPDYTAEILGYLLGRPSQLRATGDTERRGETFGDSRLLDWWLFEGKRYHGLEGMLAASWPLIDRQARRLLASHSPFKRPVPTPEGEVDWLATAHQSFQSGMPEFICRTSRLGLSTEEADALQGWRRWIATRWAGYVEALKPPHGVPVDLPWAIDPDFEADPRRLRRWAYIARRSRWPLLRNIVAESLRASFEEQMVDRLPLPTRPEMLFELLCIVRVLRAFEPEPRAIRWLDSRVTHNRIAVPGITCDYQWPLKPRVVLETVQFAPEARDAILRQNLRVPKFVDVLFRFEEPRNGFTGILMECKSGSQSPSNAVHQLKAYREALRRRMPGPLLVWGVVERPWLETWTDTQLGVPEGGRDHWVFSPVDRIPEVMRGLLG